jgi:hypothetical protein
LAGGFQAPLTKAAGLFQAFTRNLAYGVKALIDQRVAGGEGLPEPTEAASQAPEAEAEPAAEAEAEAPAADAEPEATSDEASAESEPESESESESE